MPEASRELRDCICYALFIVNIVAMIYCTGVGWAEGNTFNAWRATDQNGIVCGKGDAKDYTLSYFYYPYNTSLRYCVKKCPTYVNGTITTIDCYNCGSPSWITILENGSFTAGSSSASGSNIAYGSYPVISRICVPNSNVFLNGLDGVGEKFTSSASIGFVADFTTDIQNNWEYILFAFIMAIIISFAFMYILKCLAGCIVWMSIFSVIGLFIMIGFVFLYNANSFDSGESYSGYMGVPDDSSTKYYSYYGYIMFSIAAILIIILFCCCSRIRLAVAICVSAGQFVTGVATVMLVPIIQTSFLILLWVFGLIVMVYLASAAEFVHLQDDVFTSLKSYSD